MIAGIAIALTFSIAGILIMVKHVCIRRRYFINNKMVQAQGRITCLQRTGLGSKVRKVGSPSYEDYYKKYSVDLEYRFDVDGIEYRSTKLTFGSDVTVHNEVDEVFKQFSEGDEVSVFYKLGDPGTSVLLIDRPGSKPNSDFWMGFISLVAGLLAGYSVLEGGS